MHNSQLSSNPKLKKAKLHCVVLVCLRNEREGESFNLAFFLTWAQNRTQDYRLVLVIIIFLTNITEFGIYTLLVILAKPSRGPQIFVGCNLSMRFILTKLNLFRNCLLWGLIAVNTMPMIQHEK